MKYFVLNHHEVYLILKLLTTLTSNIAWPLLILVTILIFRKKLLSLLDKVPTILNKDNISLSVGSFSVDWSTIEKITSNEPTPDKDSNSIQMSSSLDTILQSAINLEQALTNIKPNLRRTPSFQKLRFLKKNDIISDDLYKQIYELQVMRNKIVHGVVPLDSLTVAQAISFKNAVDSVISRIENINIDKPRQTSLFDNHEF